MEKLENIIIREINENDVPREGVMGLKGFVGKYHKELGEETPAEGTPLILYNAEKNISIFGETRIHNEKMKRKQEVEYTAITVTRGRANYQLIVEFQDFIDYFSEK